MRRAPQRTSRRPRGIVRPPRAARRRSVSRPIPKGSTCVVCIGATIGKVGITSVDVSSTNQQINTVLASEQLEPRYVFYLLTYSAAVIKRHASPSPVPILSKGSFEDIQIVTSRDLAEQHEIADILEALDRKVDLHRRKRAVLEELHSSLLRELMSGALAADRTMLVRSSNRSPESAA